MKIFLRISVFSIFKGTRHARLRAPKCVCFSGGVSLRAHTCVFCFDDRSLRAMRGDFGGDGRLMSKAVNLQKSVPPLLAEHARLRAQKCMFWKSRRFQVARNPPWRESGFRCQGRKKGATDREAQRSRQCVCKIVVIIARTTRRLAVHGTLPQCHHS